jgi:hypothetical protein
VASFGGLPTSDWWRLLESEPALLHGIVKTERLIVFGGGVPPSSTEDFTTDERHSRPTRLGESAVRPCGRYCGGRANRIEQFGRPRITCSATPDAR